MSDKPLVWNGKALKTMGDVCDVIEGIAKSGNKVEALAFRSYYRSLYPRVADVNIGYSSGYYSRDMAKKILELFEVEHPVFGRAQLTSEEAFELGKKLGEAHKA